MKRRSFTLEFLLLVSPVVLAAGCWDEPADRLIGIWKVRIIHRGEELEGVRTTVHFKYDDRMTWKIFARGLKKTKTGKWQVVDAQNEELTVEFSRTAGTEKLGGQFLATFVGGDRCKLTKKDGSTVMALTREL